MIWIWITLIGVMIGVGLGMLGVESPWVVLAVSLVYGMIVYGVMS